MSDREAISPQFKLDWFLKDVIAHLWACQQISAARLDGGLRDQEPKFPAWIEIHRNWKDGFLHLLDLGERISERDLLDGGRYAWLNGYSLAFLLLASYDHQQEHFEKLAGEISQD